MMIELLWVVLFWLPGVNNPQTAGFKSAKEVCRFKRENKTFTVQAYRLYVGGNILATEPILTPIELVCE